MVVEKAVDRVKQNCGRVSNALTMCDVMSDKFYKRSNEGNPEVT